ncbi:MAG: tail fiber assembly protein [Citrobacter freundii]|jgi:hypothetical protein|nr:tail fiber assembly protein [Citrobacter freundii]MCI1827795.1 tail fiber assembly protein [Citrobacter freundii]
MADTYAIVKNGTVINVALWDGKTEWSSEGGDAILLTCPAGIGWSWDGVKFVAPAAPPVPPEQAVEQANNQKSALLAAASAVIAPLKDALDGGYIDEEDQPLLLAWQKYRYELTRVDPANPVWPAKPE